MEVKKLVTKKHRDTSFSFLVGRIFSSVKFKKINNQEELTENFVLIENTQIAINTKHKIYDHVHAVQDSNNKDRYFIGFTFNEQYCNAIIIGMIVYFNHLGECKHKIILNNVLCAHDTRNGRINTFLFNQSLIFTQIHRDTEVLLLYLNLLSYEDSVLLSTFTYSEIPSYKYNRNSIKDYKQLISVLRKDDKNIVFDLGSLKQDQSDSIVIDSYQVSDGEVDTFISEYKNPPEYFGDGYPNDCILCKNLTSITSYGYNNTYCSLGDSYCQECGIRFSKSDKKWLCQKLNLNNDFCNETVTENIPCCLEHSETMKVIIYKEREPSYIYPYKKNLHITKREIK